MLFPAIGSQLLPGHFPVLEIYKYGQTNNTNTGGTHTNGGRKVRNHRVDISNTECMSTKIRLRKTFRIAGLDLLPLGLERWQISSDISFFIIPSAFAS